MNIWQKQTVRWINDGQRCLSDIIGASSRKEFSKRFYGTLTFADGRKNQMPLTENEKPSLKMLIRLQNDEDKKKSWASRTKKQGVFETFRTC